MKNPLSLYITQDEPPVLRTDSCGRNICNVLERDNVKDSSQI